MAAQISRITEHRIWREYARHFKSKDTAEAYLTEITEFENTCKVNFFQMTGNYAEIYYTYLMEKEASGKMSMSTLSKKFWELHSFASYAAERKAEYELPDTLEDYFYPWLKRIRQQEKFVHSVPVEDMDALYQAVQEDLMAYTIIALIHRAGLSSNEIAELRPESLAVYDNGTFAYIEGRETVCYIPEDVSAILERFLSERETAEYLFYNIFRLILERKDYASDQTLHEPAYQKKTSAFSDILIITHRNHHFQRPALYI